MCSNGGLKSPLGSYYKVNFSVEGSVESNMNSAHEQKGKTARQNSIGRDEGCAFMTQPSGSHSVDNSSLPIPMVASADSSAQTSTDYVHYIRGFTDLASMFNWGVLLLTLDSSGLFLPTPLFWLCWSILVTETVIFYSIRPYWMWNEDPKKPHRLSDQGRAGAVFLKVCMSISLIVMLFYSEDLGQRQNKTLLFAGLSIILFEGFPTILIEKEEFNSLIRNPSGKGTQMIRSIIEGHDWNAANFLTPSVLNNMIGATGAITLGGKLGALMPEKPYWIIVSIFLVDLMAEAIHRFDCGKRSLFDRIPETMPSRHYIATVLRLFVEGPLCYWAWTTEEISQNSYFPLHVDVNRCDWQCQERSKSLLITMVVLGGLQAAGTFTTTLCSCVLGTQYGPYVVLLDIPQIGYLLFFLIYKFLGGLVSVVQRIICMDLT